MSERSRKKKVMMSPEPPQVSHLIWGRTCCLFLKKRKGCIIGQVGKVMHVACAEPCRQGIVRTRH